MSEPEKPKVKHHAFDFKEPGDRAAEKAMIEREGEPLYSLAFNQEDPSYVLMKIGPLTLGLTVDAAEALGEAIAGILEKMAEVRAELEQKRKDAES